MSMQFHRRLPIPQEVKAQYPLTAAAQDAKQKNDAAIASVITGNDPRLLCVVGPCSADNEDAVLTYASRLAKVQETVRDRLVLVMRVYTNKPRTTGDGYKGLLHYPDPVGKPDLYNGVLAVRRLHSRVLAESGLPTADELLYPANYRYVSDLLSYVTVGARSVEDQEHRIVSSGIEVPVGMKNPTSGDLSVMINAIHTAQRSHSFLYRGWEVTTTGNPLSHAVLRGYTDRDGTLKSNYAADDLRAVCDLYKAAQIPSPAVIVDCSHANSGKDPLMQASVAQSVLADAKRDSRIAGALRGFMIESYLEDGAQSPADHHFGQSITDPCLGWDHTERLLLSLADAI